MSTAARVRAVIVDDERAARDVLRSLLAGHPEVEIVGEATNGREAIDVIRRAAPDLVLLDVQMPDADGFAVLEALGDRVPRGVVFVTAHDEHAVRAFDVHALDYILKPFGRPRFATAIGRVLERLRAVDAMRLQETLTSMRDARATLPADAGDLADDARVRAELPRRLAVRNGSKVTLIDVAGIDWVEADGDYARVHAGKRSHLLSERMDTLERLLANGSFVRTHRSVLVRADRVSEVHREPDGSGFVVLENGVRLRVSRARWKDLMAALGID